MAKKYQNLESLLYLQTDSICRRAITEICEMLTVMGVKPGQTFELSPIKPVMLSSEIEAIDYPIIKDEPEIWCAYRSGYPSPFQYNKRDLRWDTSALLCIHTRLRLDYNRFCKKSVSERKLVPQSELSKGASVCLKGSKIFRL